MGWVEVGLSSAKEAGLGGGGGARQGKGQRRRGQCCPCQRQGG